VSFIIHIFSDMTDYMKSRVYGEMEYSVRLKELEPECYAADTVCGIGACQVVSGMNCFGESFQ
jgi:hypothetical protein